MRALLIIVSAFWSLASGAASWYVDKSASGSNTGASWANAFTNFASIAWGSVSPGDTVYISGGTVEKEYNERLTFGKAGTAESPVTVRAGQDEGHNGLVVLRDGVNMGSYNWTTLNGAKAGAPVTNLFLKDLWSITNHIGIKVVSPNWHGVYMAAVVGSKLLWVEVENTGTNSASSFNGVQHLYSGTGLEISETEIAYCYFHHNKNSGINHAANNPTKYGAIKIHRNISIYNGNNACQTSGGADVCYNYLGFRHPDFAVGHPDTLQPAGDFNRIYNNYLVGVNNSGIYHEEHADSTNSGRFLVYGNLLRNSEIKPPYGIYCGLQTNSIRPYAPTNRWNSIVIANNTITGVPGGGISLYNTYAASIRVDIAAGFILNNILWNCGTNATGGDIVLSARGTAFNMHYAEQDLRVDYNTLWSYRPMSGIRYMDSTYSTASAFATATAYDSNSNVEPQFVAPDDYDFRIQGVVGRAQGVDLTAYLPESIRQNMPDIDLDMNGRTRGADGTWDVGAFQLEVSSVVNANATSNRATVGTITVQ